MSERPAAGGAAGPGRPTGGADEPPPILGSWGRVYALVIAELVVVITLLWALTRRYS